MIDIIDFNKRAKVADAFQRHMTIELTEMCIEALSIHQYFAEKANCQDAVEAFRNSIYFLNSFINFALIVEKAQIEFQ